MRGIFINCILLEHIATMKSIHLLRILFFLNLYYSFQVAGQDHQERYDAIDVLNYRFEIDLNDTSDAIRGNASIEDPF